MQEVDGLVAALRNATLAGREEIKAKLLAMARGPSAAAVRDALDNARRGELLEVQWEIEEVLEATAPAKPAVAAAPPPPPPPPPEAPDPTKPISAKDLVLVYDDPRGLVLHKSKVGDRWFATQVDPRTGQPQTFELYAQEIQQLKGQLAGSPYWVIGSGGVAPVGAGAGKAPARPPGK
jgi:hypothetical protein